MRDAATGRARGFAFVEMATDEEAQKAAAELPKPERAFGGGDAGGRREPRW
jgi:RNA recognition motif-containing protein